MVSAAVPTASFWPALSSLRAESCVALSVVLEAPFAFVRAFASESLERFRLPFGLALWVRAIAREMPEAFAVETLHGPFALSLADRVQIIVGPGVLEPSLVPVVLFALHRADLHCASITTLVVVNVAQNSFLQGLVGAVHALFGNRVPSRFWIEHPNEY